MEANPEHPASICMVVVGPFPIKGPLTGWLKTTEAYSLQVLEATSPKSRCRQGPTISEALKALEVMPFLPLPAASGCQNPYQASVRRCITAISASVSHGLIPCMSLCPNRPLLTRLSVIWNLGPTIIQYDFILT
jgi:hypothetical protein